jgi:4-hydroxybenzoate polyprenyltransferase
MLRLPNLLTVPGDPLAGFALASLGRSSVSWLDALPAVGAALLLYCAGLIWNDFADLREDRVHRPQRPIPSGRVTLRQAAVTAAILAAAGMALAAAAGATTLLASLLLTLLVLVYDFGPRRPRLLAVLNMGACRGVSFLMGAAAASPVPEWRAPVILAALGLGLFIAAVTWIAFRETEAVSIGSRRWMPASIVASTYVLVLAAGANASWPAHVYALLAVAWLLRWAARLRGTPGPDVVGQSIGGMIRSMIPLQAAWCAGGGPGGTIAAVVLLLAWPLSAALSKRYFAS